MKINEFSLNLPDREIKGLHLNNPGKPTILAVHGWLDNAATFTNLLPYLSEFNVICIDLPGHGKSSHRSKEDYTHFIDYLFDLSAIIEALNLDKIILLGHSMGGAICSMLAGPLKNKISCIALIDILGPLVVPDEELIHNCQKALGAYSKLQHRKPKVFSSIEEAVQGRAKVSKMELSSVKILVERGIKEHDGGYIWSSDPRLMIPSIVSYSEEQIKHFLLAIEAKVMLIMPNDGWPYRELFIDSRKQYVKNLEVVNVPGNHHVHLDSPESFGKDLADFFHKNH